ncbi:MAG: DUF4276 family protein [Phormidium sp.]
MSDSLLHLEFLLEEPSLEEALSYILPKALRNKATFRTHAFRGKPDLIRKLPGRLKGYSAWLPENYKIIVLIDEDREDCQQLKQQLETIAQSAGLTTKSSNPPDKAYQVINRIVIEELEAWFFGDVDAICQAYPKVSPNLANQARYRDPDEIQGGTWEALERVLIPIFDMFAIHQHWGRARHLRFAPTAIYGMNFEKWYKKSRLS